MGLFDLDVLHSLHPYRQLALFKLLPVHLINLLSWRFIDIPISELLSTEVVAIFLTSNWTA